MIVRVSVIEIDPLEAALPVRRTAATNTEDTGPPINPERGTNIKLNPTVETFAICQKAGMLIIAARPKTIPTESENACFDREIRVSGIKL